jgi:hypothetical protein
MKRASHVVFGDPKSAAQYVAAGVAKVVGEEEVRDGKRVDTDQQGRWTSTAADSVRLSAMSIKERSRAFRQLVVDQFGFLFDGLRFHHFAFRVRFLWVTLATVILNTFIPTTESGTKLFLLSLVFLSEGGWMTASQPFADKWLNTRKALVYLGQALQAFIMLGLQFDRTAADWSSETEKETQAVMFFTLVGLYSAGLILFLFRKQVLGTRGHVEQWYRGKHAHKDSLEQQLEGEAAEAQARPEKRRCNRRDRTLFADMDKMEDQDDEQPREQAAQHKKKASSKSEELRQEDAVPEGKQRAAASSNSQGEQQRDELQGGNEEYFIASPCTAHSALGEPIPGATETEQLPTAVIVHLPSPSHTCPNGRC